MNYVGVNDNLTKHHLIPQVKHNKRTKKKFDDIQKTINICSMCHTTIHATFDNNFLRDFLNTKQLLLQNEKFKKYLDWRKKHLNFKSNSTKMGRK